VRPKSLCQKDRCSLMRIGESFLSPMLRDELDLTRSQARHIFKRFVNPNAWKACSANFACTEFSEVRTGLRELASCSCGGKG
jgi:hypothetical protein